MEQNYFQFRENIYKVKFGTNMDNPLSPLIAELFMSAFEVNLHKQKLLPRIWHRYVDDVLAIVHKNDIQKTLDILNNQFESINFTFETENENKLPFLDLIIHRTNETVQFSVYHKPTSTIRTITSNSFCPIQHKLAANHSAIHRLCRLPLSIANHMEEYQYIKETANVNGYSEKMVEKLVYKQCLLNMHKKSKKTI